MAAKLTVGADTERDRVTLTAETSTGKVGTFRLTAEAADELGRKLISKAQFIEVNKAGAIERMTKRFADLWT